MQQREVRLKNRPVGLPRATDFEVVENPVGDPADGQVRVRNLCMSVDPYMRGRMIERKSYVPPFALGEVLTGGAVGRVVDSRHPGFAEGDLVRSMFGWREAYVAPAAQVEKLPALEVPPSAFLGVLGMPGLTAYAGLLAAGEYRDGDTVFVSGAAGAVGSLVGQIARLRGSHVVGSAGSADKVRHLVDDLGFSAAFDYHDGNLPAQLARLAPGGLDVYFDNVGGDHLEAAIGHMKPGGRLALCGAIAQYNDTAPRPGPNNLVMAIGLGLTLRGFIVSQYGHLNEAFIRDMGGWLQSGAVRYRETVHTGIDQAAQAFIGLFTGDNVGKMVVQLGE